MFHNTGLSSSINWGNQLLTTEADIVTAHGEFTAIIITTSISHHILAGCSIAGS